MEIVHNFAGREGKQPRDILVEFIVFAEEGNSVVIFFVARSKLGVKPAEWRGNLTGRVS